MSVFTTTEKSQYDQNFTWYDNIKDVPIANNDIINGDFLINQYADIDTIPVVIVSGTYQIDRYLTILSVVTATIQRLLSQLVNGKYVNTLTMVATSTASGSMRAYQKIEKSYKGEVKTFGHWVKSNNSEAKIMLDDGGYTIGDSHSGGGGWEFLTVTATISASATDLRIYTGIVSDGIGSVSITIGDYVESTMWQLESGSVNTDYEQTDYALERIKCQRYLPYRSQAGFLYNRHGNGIASSTTRVILSVPTKVTARIAPSIVSYNGNLALWDGATFIAVTALSIYTSSNSDMITLTVDVASGLTIGQSYQLTNNNDVTAYIEIPTEL